MKKALSALLALIVALTMAPVFVLADETDDGFQYADYNGGVRIYNYAGDASVLNIPAYIDGKKVIKIDTMAFGGALVTQNITGVTIPDTVEEISNGAFIRRANLTRYCTVAPPI